MPRVLVNATEIEVLENLDSIWTRVAHAEQGVSQGARIVAPPGWIILTPTETGGEPVYVQASNIGLVRP